MILRGNIERGKKAFIKAKCVLCHRFNEMGRDYGPDLTTIGSRFSRKDLIESVIYPSKTLSDLYPADEIVTRDGNKLIGPVVAENDQQVTVAVMGLTRQSIPKKDIQSRAPAKVSTMPDGLLDDLTTAEAADLFALLQSAKEKPKP
jgi:putative heme-binding domain-containing protein